MSTYLPQQERLNDYTGNGTEDTYIYSFKILDEKDLAVWVTLDGALPDPVADKKVLNVDYSVTGVDVTTGGTIVFTTPPALDSTIVIRGRMDNSINVNFSDAQNWSGANLDDTLERLTMMVQQNSTEIDTMALRYPLNAIVPNDESLNIVPLLSKDRSIWMRSGGQIIDAVLEENPDVSTLRSELEAATSLDSGSHIVGYWDKETSLPTNVKLALDSLFARIAVLENSELPTSTVVPMYDNTAPSNGWVIMNDGTIGNASSNATIRANADTEALFKILWDRVSDSWCPVYDDNGLKVLRGASATEDYTANRQIALPNVVGRVISTSGIAYFNKTITADNTTNELVVDDSSQYLTALPVKVAAGAGGVLPTGIVADTEYYLIIVDATHVALATTTTLAKAGTKHTFSDDGTAPLSLEVQFSNHDNGGFYGYGKHNQTDDELREHAHGTGFARGARDFGGGDQENCWYGSGTSKVDEAGGDQAMNITQPTTYITNYIIKL